MSMVRTRWAALGAAVAITLGAGGVSLSQAALGSGDRPVFVPIEPCRLIDTRPENQIGPKSTPLGPNETITIQVTGSTGECSGVPAGAVGAAMNMTAIRPTAQSFLTVHPSDGDRPNASNLNWAAGDPPTPNKVDVKLGVDGAVKAYNSIGTVHLAADLVGYYIDHHHDDRYYTEAEVDAAFDALPDVLSATVDAGIPTTLVRGVGATEVVRLNAGNYRVRFDRDVSGCTYVASAGQHTAGIIDDTAASTAPDVTDAFRVVVRIFDVSGNLTDGSFHLIVVCPT